MIEVIVSSVILLVMIQIVATLTQSGSAAQKYAERINRVTELSQELIDDIRVDLTSSVRLFYNDSIGNGYLAKLDLTQVKSPISSSKLPALDSVGIFQMETLVQPRSGNCLLFARHAWTAAYTVGANTYQVDVYRIAYFYLTEEDGGPRPGRPMGLNVCKWVGEPMVDGGQIDKISDPFDQAAVLQNLVLRNPDNEGVVHPKVEVAWGRGEDPTVTGTFRHIQTTGGMFDNPQAPRSSPWRLERDPKWSSDSLLYYRHHSVATNFASGSRVGTFSLISAASGGFPHGFEVQLIGPSAARQLMIRLVLVSTNLNGHSAFGEIQAVVAARDI